jgi:RNA polymerase sigma-70 factor (ECF subfamily)
MKLSELAQQGDINLRTLETRLYRAKKILREMWKEECGNG